MFKSTKLKKEEEEPLELMVELDLILTAHAMLKCLPAKKQKMLKKKSIKHKLPKLTKNN